MVAAHNLDVIKSADWITDLELEGGEAGGHIVPEGPIEAGGEGSSFLYRKIPRPLVGS